MYLKFKTKRSSLHCWLNRAPNIGIVNKPALTNEQTERFLQGTWTLNIVPFINVLNSTEAQIPKYIFRRAHFRIKLI